MSHYNEGNPSLETWVEPTLLQTAVGFVIEHDDTTIAFNDGPARSAEFKEILLKRATVGFLLSGAVVTTARLKGWL